MKKNQSKKLVIAAVLLFASSLSLFGSSLVVNPPKSLHNAISSFKGNSLKRADFNFKNVEFDFNSAAIRKQYYGELDKLAEKLKATNASLKVSGFADNRGTYLYNWKLSQARAESVKNYIISKGYNKTQIAATEFGDTKPIATNKTRAGRQRNRRVEVEAY